MIDSIFVALSGMLGHQRGLSVISNNVSNMNTAGFRGSIVSFADVFIGAPDGSAGGQRGVGAGVDASNTRLDFRFGDPIQTGVGLDLMLAGEGFFVLQDENGELRYTRNGHFDFVDDELVAQDQRFKVMTRNASGQLVPISIKDLKTSAPKKTSELTLEGTLSSGDPDRKVTVQSVEVFDSEGRKHTLTIEFTLDTTAPMGFIVWKVSVLESGQEIGSGEARWLSPADNPSLEMPLALAGAQAIEVSFNLDDVLVGSVGTQNTSVSVTKQDGFATGSIGTRTFDENGVLKLTYTNGQEADGPKLVLAQISDQSALVQLSDALFAYRGEQPAALREAGDDLHVVAQSLEQSNVDITEAFTQLILMQRGFQSSSQVLSTANDMLQELFDLRGQQ